jgi:adenosylcobinamide-GDP ribazoletransferase
MSALTMLRGSCGDFVSAIHFLTRIPVPAPPYRKDSLACAVKFFPIIGLLIGSSAALIHLLLIPHLSRVVSALVVVVFLVAITGCLHEDGLADAADGFGGGWTRDQVLLILRDSRIGSYGAAALILSLLARILLISSMPVWKVLPYLIAAHVLCRWTTLPLSFYLAPARTAVDKDNSCEPEGLGAHVARLTTIGTFLWGSAISFFIVAVTLRSHAITPILLAVIVTLLTGMYYRRRIAGVTGDCFGATNQLTEIAVYLCGAWIV